LRSPHLLPVAILRFYLLRRSARKAKGYIHGAICVADVRTLINISLWRSRQEMLAWTGRREHVDAVRAMYRWSRATWSAEAIEPRISPSAATWE
jgi:heme-degrading monooxygenase HmoA